VHKAVIAGNWKMHMTCAQARAYAQAFAPLVAHIPGDRDVVPGPPVHRDRGAQPGALRQWGEALQPERSLGQRRGLHR